MQPESLSKWPNRRRAAATSGRGSKAATNLRWCCSITWTWYPPIGATGLSILYSGAIRDGHIYGRGALDMKGLGIVQLAGVPGAAGQRPQTQPGRRLRCHGGRGSGRRFRRRLAGREAPGDLRRRRAICSMKVVVAPCRVRIPYSPVETTQKVPLWLRLIAHGNPGHGSTPQTETSVTRILRAGDRLRANRVHAAGGACRAGDVRGHGTLPDARNSAPLCGHRQCRARRGIHAVPAAHQSLPSCAAAQHLLADPARRQQQDQRRADGGAPRTRLPAAAGRRSGAASSRNSP